jgi:putative transposase
LLARLNEACSWLAKQAFDLGVFGQFPLHRRFYSELRQRFGLQSQQAVRVVAQVAHTFATLKANLAKRHARQATRHARDVAAARAQGKTPPEAPPKALLCCPTFRPDSAFPFDARLFTLRPASSEVSVAGPEGKRVVVPFVVAKPQRPLLLDPTRVGEADLTLRDGQLYLYLSCQLDEGEAVKVERFLGVDKGVVNLATDSDGRRYTGAHVERVRLKYHHLRQQLQACGSKSARRALKTIGGKEARFRRLENHRIANQIVATAQGTGRGLALEDLRGIRDRITVTKAQRARISGWSFRQLDQFVLYKALANNVPVVFVDPRDTSRTCPMPGCRHVDAANRPSRDVFRCVKCGHEREADWVGAENISQKAEVNRLSVLESGNPLGESGSPVQASHPRGRGSPKPRPSGRGRLRKLLGYRP